MLAMKSRVITRRVKNRWATNWLSHAIWADVFALVALFRFSLYNEYVKFLRKIYILFFLFLFLKVYKTWQWTTTRWVQSRTSPLVLYFYLNTKWGFFMLIWHLNAKEMKALLSPWVGFRAWLSDSLLSFFVESTQCSCQAGESACSSCGFCQTIGLVHGHKIQASRPEVCVWSAGEQRDSCRQSSLLQSVACYR